jgi:hypothetical protein
VTTPTRFERRLILVPADVDGHRGNYILDTGSPVVLFNAVYLQKNEKGGLDTIDASASGGNSRQSPAGNRPATAASGWAATGVTVRIGTHAWPVEAGNVEYQLPVVAVLHPLSPEEDPKFEDVLGILGLPAFAQYETVIDYARRRLVLIPLDEAGRRLVDVPAYQPKTQIPMFLVNMHWHVAAKLGGVADTLNLDTGNWDNMLGDVMRQRIAAHVHQTDKPLDTYWRRPIVTIDSLMLSEYVYPDVEFVNANFGGSKEALGNAFFQQQGAVGFNFKTGQLRFYQ